MLVTCGHSDSGLIVGRPAQEKGLTAESVARDYADCILSMFDVPVEITSDNGPQYAATIWWKKHHLNGTRTTFG